MWYWDPVNHSNGPGAGSWFHFLWLAIFVLTSFIFIRLAKKHDEKQEILITRIFGFSLIILEIIKQIVCFNFYNCFKFKRMPFDLCSIPMYTIFISSFITRENSKVKNNLYILSVALGFVGGFATLIYPTPLKTPNVLKSIHTMFFHSMIAVYAIYIYISKRFYENRSLKKYIIPLLVFVGLCFIAVAINEIAYYTYIKPNNLDLETLDDYHFDRCNCFYLTYRYKTVYPVLNLIQFKVPFLVFVFLFIISFSLIVLILDHSICTIYLIVKSRKSSNKINQ